MALDTTKVHDTLYEYCHGYIPVQEITHAANQICLNPTEETVIEMTTYLDQFDKEFIPLQTVNVKSITSNQIRFGMAEIRKVIKAGTTDENPDENIPETGDDKKENEGGTV